MRVLFGIILYLISSCGLFAQISGTILNKETKEILPYVTVRLSGTDKGTTSDFDGTYRFNDVLDTDTIIYSSVGFQKETMLVTEIKDTIYLTQNVTELPLVSVRPMKGKTNYQIGGIKKSKINSYHGCGEKLYAIGRKFEYKDEYQNTPFVELINLMTKSDVEGAKLLIDIREMKANEQVGNSLIPNALILAVRKRRKITTLNVSEYQIKFPKTGLFIGITWLMIPSNKYEYTVTMMNDKKKLKKISYEPAVGMIKTETNEDCFINLNGKWQNSFKAYDLKKGKAIKTKYSYLQIPLEIVLSD